MIKFVVIGIGAGVAAALLFASVTSGIWLSIPLFYLAPLPIMIAGLGWSHWAALIASLTGALTLGAVFGVVFLFAFLAGAGVPAWWLGYLAMLARPVPANGARWPASSRARMVSARASGDLGRASRHAGGDRRHSQFRNGRRKLSCRVARRAQCTSCAQRSPRRPMTPSGMPARADRLIEFLVSAIPLAAAVLATITNLFNLWLAARIVKVFRPAGAALAAAFGPAVSASADGGPRPRRRVQFRRRNTWHRGRYRVGSPAAGLWRTRLCSAACYYARPANSSLLAWPCLCGRISHRLADTGGLLARTDRCRF